MFKSSVFTLIWLVQLTDLAIELFVIGSNKRVAVAWNLILANSKRSDKFKMLTLQDKGKRLFFI